MVENKSIKNIAVALGQFQSKCPTINKNTKGYGYKYADLPYIIKTITPILKDCNLSFTQLVGGDNGNVSVTTVLIHSESGEYFETTISADVASNKGSMSLIQAVGSVITYLRRYSLSAILGIVTDEDIDGHVATPTKSTNKPQTSAKPNQATATKSKTPLTIDSVAYNSLFEKYRDAKSNEERNKVKTNINLHFSNANDVIGKLDAKYKEYLEAKK